MWIAPDLRYLPVRIRIEQDPSTFIDLMISKKPEIAAAPAVASASSGKDAMTYECILTEVRGERPAPRRRRSR